jgi:hypothetical protein
MKAESKVVLMVELTAAMMADLKVCLMALQMVDYSVGRMDVMKADMLELMWVDLMVALMALHLVDMMVEWMDEMKVDKKVSMMVGYLGYSKALY